MAAKIAIFSLKSLDIDIKVPFSILANSAISLKHDLAIPLDDYKILIIKIKDLFFSPEPRWNTSCVWTFDVKPTVYSDPEELLPLLCGNQLCSLHRNFCCEKSEHHIKIALSNRYYLETSFGVIDLDWSPPTMDRQSLLLALTARGDSYIYNWSFGNLTLFFDIRNFFIKSLMENKHFLKSLPKKVPSNIMIQHAKWLPYLKKLDSLIICLILRVNYSGTFYNILCFVELKGTLKILSATKLEGGTSEPSSLSVCQDSLSKHHVVCIGVCPNHAEIYIFSPQWESFKFSLSTSTSLINVCLTCTASDLLRVSLFSLNRVDIYEVDLSSIGIEQLPILGPSVTVPSRSSSPIVNGVDRGSYLVYVTRNGGVFVYDFATSQYSLKQLDMRDDTQVVSKVLFHPNSPALYIIRLQPGSNRIFRATDALSLIHI